MSDILEMADDDFMRQGETLLSTSAPEKEQFDNVVQEDNDLPDTSKDEILAKAKIASAKWLENSEILKEIVVPNKLVNFVIKG